MARNASTVRLLLTICLRLEPNRLRLACPEAGVGSGSGCHYQCAPTRGDSRPGRRLVNHAKSPQLRRSAEGQFQSVEWRSEEHTSELQSRGHLVCRRLLEKK